MRRDAVRGTHATNAASRAVRQGKATSSPATLRAEQVLWRLLASGQDLLLSSPSHLLVSTFLITLLSPPCLAPVPLHGDSAAAPKSCRSTSCPSAPALHHREGPLPSQLHGGTSAAPLPSPPATEVTAGEVGKAGLLRGAAHGALPAACPLPVPDPSRLALAAFSLVLLCSAAVAP